MVVPVQVLVLQARVGLAESSVEETDWVQQVWLVVLVLSLAD